jgi:hypothetical protein
MTAGVAVAAGAIALAMWTHQPDTDEIASPATPHVPPASSARRAPDSANPVLVATSGRIIEPASAPQTQRAGSATVPAVPEAQPRRERSDATAAAAANAEPQLTVITEPVGAHVTVNGVRWGTTPVTIRYLDPGIKRVRVTRDGYRSEERLTRIERGGLTTTLRIPMRTEADGNR